MKRIALSCCLALAAFLAADCTKRQAPSASAEAVAGPGRLLPPGAYGYFAFDVRAALASAAVAPHANTLLGLVPPPCAELLRAVDRVVVAGYGPGEDAMVIFPRKRDANEPPRDANFVAVIEGAKRAPVDACFDELSRQDDATPPPPVVQTVEGREVRTTGSAADLRLFSVDETTHVLATPQTLEKALAAAAGGASIAGSPALEALGSVPHGTVTAGLALTAEMSAEIFGTLGEFSGGRPVTMPRSLGVSVTLGSEIAVTMALQTAADAEAQALEQAARTSLAAFQRLAKDGARGGGRGWEAPFVRHATVSRSGAVVLFGARFPFEAILQGFLAGGEDETGG